MLNTPSKPSRSALVLLLALSLTASGCQVCFPASERALAFLELSPTVSVESDTLFGPIACVDPIDYLFLVLMGFAPSLDDAYVPGSQFLRPEPVGQFEQPGGHVALTLGREGGVISTGRISSDVQAYDAVLEPLGAAERRLSAAGEPVSRRVFLSDSDGQTVVAVDPASNQVVATIPVGRDPHGLAFSPDGSTLYVGNNGSSSVSVVDVESLTVTGSLSLPGGGSPVGVAVTPDGATLYVVNGADSGTVVAFDLAGGAAPQSIRVGRQPKRIRLTPDGSLAFIANFGANNISVLDTRTNTLVAALNADRPSDIVVSPDGNQLYVVHAGTLGRVSEIDVASLQETRSWEVGDTPLAAQLMPDGATLLVTNRNSPFVSLIDLVHGGDVVNAAAPEGLGPAAVVAMEDRPVLSAGN